MTAPRVVTVDVQDMVCAQALAVVAAAMARVQPGDLLDVRCNADDVHRDLIAWARHAGHALRELDDRRLHITRRAEEPS